MSASDRAFGKSINSDETPRGVFEFIEDFAPAPISVIFAYLAGHHEHAAGQNGPKTPPKSPLGGKLPECRE